MYFTPNMQWNLVISVFVLFSLTLPTTNAEEMTQLIKSSKSEYTFSRYLRNVCDWLKNDVKQDLINFTQGRTFGAIAIRRLQFTFIPLFYKLGVIGTMVAFLTMITLKGLAIGVLLLILNLSNFLANIQTAKFVPNVPNYYHPRPSTPPLTKTVHLHIHNDGGHHEVAHSDPGYLGYGGSSGGNYGSSYGGNYGSYADNIYSHKPSEYYGKINRMDDLNQDNENWNESDSYYSQSMADELNDKGYLGNLIEKFAVG